MLSKLHSTLAAAVAAAETAAGAFDDQPPARIMIERGVAWPVLDQGIGNHAFAWMEPLLLEEFDLEALDVTDRAGHRRSVYPGLLVYALFQAVRSSDQVLLDVPAETAIRHIDTLQTTVAMKASALGNGPLAGEAIPASAGESVAALAWQALALFAGGELVDDDRALRCAARAIRAIAARQTASGGYLSPSRSDSPETLWLHELQILHAVSSFALQAGDQALRASAAKAAAFHLNETQPDHASNQPWGLPAFMIDESTHIMADAMLHAASVEQPDGLSGVTLILLADALYSWRRR